jgi:23S rRNA pseudouridine1911/1915/1917 synthase
VGMPAASVMSDPWRVPTALDGERLDRALALITGLSRGDVSDLIADGRVSVQRRVATTRSRRVRADEIVEVEGELPHRDSRIEPDPSVEFQVVWFDEQVAVVDKPAGLVVHPGAGNPAGTLINGLLARFPDLGLLDAAPEEGDERALQTGDRRPGIVQRLDKGTSGLLVVARTSEARDSLVTQLSRREVGRRYVSLVHGVVEADGGLVDAPLGRSTDDPTRIRVQAGGREARTRYEVLQRGEDPPVSLLRCRLETGRTHQIRVHLASIGHPVIGDVRYGTKLGSEQIELPRGRFFLHAEVLEFDHPVSGERLRFRSELPGDLRTVLDRIDPGWAASI